MTDHLTPEEQAMRVATPAALRLSGQRIAADEVEALYERLEEARAEVERLRSPVCWPCQGYPDDMSGPECVKCGAEL